MCFFEVFEFEEVFRGVMEEVLGVDGGVGVKFLSWKKIRVC